MNNIQRGEVQIEGPDGKLYTLCLTLGAIAQIEEQIDGIDSLSEIDEVFSKGRMRDIIFVFVSLLNGGGHWELTPKDMMSWQVPMDVLVKKIEQTFKAAGFGGSEEEQSGN